MEPKDTDSDFIFAEFEKRKLSHTEGISVLVACICKAVAICSAREDNARNIRTVVNTIYSLAPGYAEVFEEFKGKMDEDQT